MAAPDRLTQLLSILESEPNDAFCLYGVAQEYVRRGESLVAVAWFDRCLAADPGHCYAYYHKAKALEDAGREADAVATLRLGLAQAKAARDGQAISEIAAYLDQLT